MYRENLINLSYYSITHREFFLLDFKKQSQQNGKWNNNVGESSATNFRSMLSSYIVKLAPESPCNRSYEHHAHDESSYDSFHNWETGK